MRGVAATPELEQARRDKLSAKSRYNINRIGEVAGHYTWSHEQVRTLKEMWARDAPIKQIEHETGRTRRAIFSMRQYLELPLRKVEGKPRLNRVSVHLDDQMLEMVRRRAQYYRRDVHGYIRMLLKRDGAL